MCTTCPAYHILLDLINRLVFDNNNNIYSTAIGLEPGGRGL